MSHNGLHAMWILTIASAALVAGCSSGVIAPSSENEMPTALAAVQQLYGPPGRGIPQQFLSEPLFVDLNGDGRTETIVVFGDEGIDRPKFGLENTEGHSVVCAGFLVLTEVNGRKWPVFYFFNENRCSIHLSETAREHGIVASGGKDGEYIFWGWRKDNGELPAAWEARHRQWDRAKSDYGLWQAFPPLHAIYGK